ncbi:precorrin-6A synthase (deacetylating) [Ensifer soli]|uniref:precorrin-6A synthase (deacetylating) n=1 Tax=Ciceribacter sp. sgz301302 TaxID=3342379 RepID=UPI0035B8123C
MRTISIVGIGAGHPEQITLEAIRVLNDADVLFIPDKGEEKAALAAQRRALCARHVTNPSSRTVDFAVPVRRSDLGYLVGVDEWHAAIATIYERLIRDELGEDGTGAFLVWGDPMLYDSTIRILDRVKTGGRVAFEVTVVPGITSIQALAARHRIALNRVGRPVEITTGRRLADNFPGRIQTAVVMLDGVQAFMEIDDPDVLIYWGAYLGTDMEITLSGRLAEVKGAILAARAEARARHGWIMDIYLMTKGADFEE